MDTRKTSLERAFELARSEKCINVSEIIKHLRIEQYEISQIEGPTIRKQLTQLIEASRASGGTTKSEVHSVKDAGI